MRLQGKRSRTHTAAHGFRNLVLPCRLSGHQTAPDRIGDESIRMDCELFAKAVEKKIRPILIDEGGDSIISVRKDFTIGRLSPPFKMRCVQIN